MPFPPTILAARMLLALDALKHIAFGAAAPIGGIPSAADPRTLRWAMAGLAGGAAAALASLAFLLSQRNRSAFYPVVILLVIIAVLSITDQAGWIDIAALALSVIPLVLLVRDRSWFLGREIPHPSETHG